MIRVLLHHPLVAENTYTMLAEKQPDFVINYSALTRVAITVISQRSARKYRTLAKTSVNNSIFGGINLVTVSPDQNDDKGSGAATPYGSLYHKSTNLHYSSRSIPGQTTPDAFTTL